MNELTQRGINALKANDRASARKLLAAALQQDQNDATAWLWLAAAMETPGQRIDCLRQVLKIEPNNQAALKGLAALGAPAMKTPGQPASAPPTHAAAEMPPPARAAAPVQEPPDVRKPSANQPAPSPQPLSLDELRGLASIDSAPDAESTSADTETTFTGAESISADIEKPFAPAESAPADEVETSMDAASEPVEAENPSAYADRISAYAGNDPAAQAPSAPATSPVARYRPPVRAEREDDADARKIFKTRPSNIPALMAFWLFFFGALFIGSQVNALNPGGTIQAEGFLEGMPFAIFGLLFSLGLGLLLEFVVVFVVIRNMRTRYELTSASLTIPFRGRRTRIPVRDIYHVECRQSFMQRLYGAGDVLVNTVVQGELNQVRLRSIPKCDKRAQEIAYLIQDQAT